MARLDTLTCDKLQVLHWWTTELSGMNDELWQRLNSLQRVRFETLDGETRRREWSTARRGEFALQDRFPAQTKLVLSVAHCAGAVSVVASSEARALGVDVEPIGRTLTPRLLQRIVQAREAHNRLKPLQWWTLKESLFKCAPREGGHLSEYVVTHFDGVSSGRAQHGDLEISFQLYEIEGFLLSISWR